MSPGVAASLPAMADERDTTEIDLDPLGNVDVDVADEDARQIRRAGPRLGRSVALSGPVDGLVGGSLSYSRSPAASRAVARSRPHSKRATLPLRRVQVCASSWTTSVSLPRLRVRKLTAATTVSPRSNSS